MYKLELEKVIYKIKKEDAKLVCIQLADGLKPKAKKIVEEIEKNTEAAVAIWMSTCFGACDTPNIKNMDFDLLVQFGHVKMQGLDFEHARKFPAIGNEEQAELANDKGPDGKYRHTGWKDA